MLIFDDLGSTLEGTELVTFYRVRETNGNKGEKSTKSILHFNTPNSRLLKKGKNKNQQINSVHFRLIFILIYNDTCFPVASVLPRFSGCLCWQHCERLLRTAM